MRIENIERSISTPLSTEETTLEGSLRGSNELAIKRQFPGARLHELRYSSIGPYRPGDDVPENYTSSIRGSDTEGHFISLKLIHHLLLVSR